MSKHSKPAVSLGELNTRLNALRVVVTSLACHMDKTGTEIADLIDATAETLLAQHGEEDVVQELRHIAETMRNVDKHTDAVNKDMAKRAPR